MAAPTQPAIVPEIKQCWDAIWPHLPVSDPSDPLDPSVNLATLAAIAHAKWAKCDALLMEIERLESVP